MKVAKEGYSGRLGRDRLGEDLKENNERFRNNESENSTEDVMTAYTSNNADNVADHESILYNKSSQESIDYSVLD